MEQHLRVLLVEDDEEDYLITRDLLAESRSTRFDLDWVGTFEEGLEAIRRNGYDVYLLDYRLGEYTGLDLLRIASSEGCRRPIILLTGQDDADIDTEAMNLGAAEYLIKGQIDAALLERTIRYSVAICRTMIRLRDSEERYALAAQAANDGLWDWSLETGRVYYSPRWLEMVGLRNGHASPDLETWLGLVHPDDVYGVRSTLENHLAGESPHFESEYRLRTPQGEYRWMLARGLAVRSPDGVVTRIAGSQTDITERRRAVEQLTHDALHDLLTGLPNRALFMDRLAHALQSARRDSDHKFAVLVLDLDRFKLVNDSLGHALGDELLVLVSQRLRTVVRSTDTVARLGGDEFAILLDRIDHISDAVRSAVRVQEVLREPFLVDGRELYSTISIGIALSATGYDRAEDILRDADAAMYRAKSRGRARHEIFDKQMHANAVNLLQMETELRHAISRSELRLFYQPILSLQTGKVDGFEALVRWQRGSELVSAAEFVPLAEETGLIVPLGTWALGEACRQLAQWSRNGLRVSVNLSVKQFVQSTLIDDVRAAIVASGINPSCLDLEVTESVIIDSDESAMTLLTSLRALKVNLSLDDFGTGYASLSSLHRYPFTTLKIDQSFTRRLTHDPRTAEIMRTISTLARTLGLDVTVEGVETREQFEAVRQLGITRVQGFYFHRPLPPDQARALLHE